MTYVDIMNYDDSVLCYVDVDLADEYEKGILNNFYMYVQRVSQDVKKDENEKLFVSDSLITNDFIKKYFEKSDFDYSAKDCVYMALNHQGVPPKDELSLESLEKTIREIMKDKKDTAYIKRTSGKGNTLCVDYITAQEIICHSNVKNLIKKQIIKAENNHADNVEWRAYEFEKEKIAFLDSLNSHDEDVASYRPKTLSMDEKTQLMVKAIFGRFFSDFDFEKYEAYLNEMNLLYDAWDFGERYQELYDILNSKNYKEVFYTSKQEDAFVDAMVDKIIEKIIKKMGNNTI